VGVIEEKVAFTNRRASNCGTYRIMKYAEAIRQIGWLRHVKDYRFISKALQTVNSVLV